MDEHIKSLDEVLDSKELDQVHSIENDVNSVEDINFMAGMPHLDCSVSEKGVSIEIEPMWKNPYVILSNQRKHTYTKPSRTNYDDLFEKRRQIKENEFLREDKLSFSEREKLIRREHFLRAEDIEIHKFYLSEVMRRNVGIVAASAHWLRTVGRLFYNESEEHYSNLGVQFSWEGLERAIGLKAIDKMGCNVMYVVGCSKDFLKEENWAQFFAGFTGKNRVCILARERLKVLHDSKYLCVLHNPEDDS